MVDKSLMRLIQLQIPDSVELEEFEIKMLLATRLYEQGRLSSGQAAEFAGLSKRAFVELLGKYGVSLFGYDFEELVKDLEDVEWENNHS